MLLDIIKNGCTISPEDFATLHKEILFTHLVVQTPQRNEITVRIRRIYSDEGKRINSRDLFFYVQPVATASKRIGDLAQ